MKDTENTPTGAGSEITITVEEAARLLKGERDGIACGLIVNSEEFEMALDLAIARLKGELFTLEELKSWLYAVAMNNLGQGFGDFVEELIGRLDGFQRFVADRREAQAQVQGSSEEENKRFIDEVYREAWEDQMRQDAIEAQAAQDEEPGLIFGGDD